MTKYIVIKKDGSEEEFNIDKIFEVIQAAGASEIHAEVVVNKIIERLFKIKSSKIRGLVYKYLKDINKKDIIEKKDNIIFVNNKPLFFTKDNQILPTLHLILENNFLKTITVDMGAVKFVCKGADIMRPGITNIDPEIKENEIITIVEETHNKPLAIGKALLSANDMQNATEGKVIQNLHYIGDEIWNSK